MDQSIVGQRMSQVKRIVKIPAARGSTGEAYRNYNRRKVIIIISLTGAVIIAAVTAMALGSASLSPFDVLKALTGRGDQRMTQIVLNIRLPRVLAAIVAGIGLSVSGCMMQNVLRNPLASDYTLGISQGAAFGAAVAILAVGAGSVNAANAGTDALIITNPYLVTAMAFAGAMIATGTILLLARSRGIPPEAMVLAGVAMGFLFLAGTVLAQYFATDVQVASIVFWTFGDLGRASWNDLIIMSVVTLPSLVFFLAKRWDYNSLSSGDDVARSLGVNVERTRATGMFLASLVTATIVSFIGIIAFLGLAASHLMRRVMGNDYRFLTPASAVTGALLLLLADTFSRTIIAPVVLPVGAVTSLMGAPLFIYLLVRGYGKHGSRRREC